MRVPSILALLVLAPLAGCLDAPGFESGAAAFTESGGRNDDLMSARLASTESSARRGGDHVIENVTTLEGHLALAELEVTLATVNGKIVVKPGREGEWRLVVQRVAKGPTQEDARAHFDRMEFRWAHESGGEHFLKAAVSERRTPAPRAGSHTAHLTLEAPPSLLMALRAESVNGMVEARSVRAPNLDLSTVNGRIVAEASDVGHARLESVNGGIEAALRPAWSGRIVAESVNGNVALRVPEGALFGYDATADTVNGAPRVELEDGETRTEGRFGPKSARFRTTDMDDRMVRVGVDLDTVNGNIVLAPL